MPNLALKLELAGCQSAPGIAVFAELQMSFTMREGVAPEQDRGNRIFVLVGPPAEEPRSSDK